MPYKTWVPSKNSTYLQYDNKIRIYQWNSMYQDGRRFINKCHVCQISSERLEKVLLHIIL